MVTYSIKDLEKLSGIKAHTIRIWEQRYNIIEPKRTQTNIRYYTDEDLKYLLNIAFLNKNGVRISKISKMSKNEISDKVGSISRNNLGNCTQLQALTIAMIELSEIKFEEIIRSNIQQEGFDTTASRVIVPFLEKLSLLWLTGSISTVHEQFIIGLIRRKVLAAIDRLPLPIPDKKTKKIALYLPQGEGDEQEIILLITQYFLRKMGCYTVYLGTRITISDLGIANEIHKPDYIYTILSENRTKPPAKEYVRKLCGTLSNTTFLLSGYQVVNCSSMPSFNNMSILEDFRETIAFFRDHLVGGEPIDEMAELKKSESVEE